MGAIIAVLATFDIHIEIKEVVPMNPTKRSGGLVPTLFNTNDAIRLWRFQTKINFALTNWPKKLYENHL